MRDISSAAIALVATLLSATPAPAGPGYVTLPDGEVLRVVLPETAPRGLVLLLPDALGGDPRSAPYVAALLAAGIGAAEPQWQRVPAAEQAERGRRLVARLPDAARGLGVPADAIGLVGFGFGARSALQAAFARGWPAALLYPGCAGLLAAEPSPAGEPGPRWQVALQPPGDAPPSDAPLVDAPHGDAPPVLLLHGSADAAEPAEACAGLVARLGPTATRHVYYGATYGWDYAPGPWENMASLLPSPDGAGPLRRAHMSTGVTADAATRVAGFLARHVAAPPGPQP